MTYINVCIISVNNKVQHICTSAKWLSTLCSTGAIDILLGGQWLKSDLSFTDWCLKQFLQFPWSYFWFASLGRVQYLSPQVQQRVYSLDVKKKKKIMLFIAVLLRKDNSKREITAGKCSINAVALRWLINLCSTCRSVEGGLVLLLF